MLSCLVPPRFGQEDQMMPSSTAFSLQFPSLAQSLHHTDKQHFDNSSNYHHQNSTPSPPISTTSPIGGIVTPSDLTSNHHQQHLGNGHQHHHHHPYSSLQQQQQHQQEQQRQHQHAMAMAIANMTGAKSPPTLNGYDEGGRSTSSPGSSTTLGDLCSPHSGSLTGPGGPYTCAQCSAAFPTRDMLEKHEMMHSPNTTVCCKICHKTFANVYRLQRHMISHDESALLRKFKCTECDKAFKFKHHLKEHVRIHSGEKPFACDNCGKRFSHSGSYSSHMTSKKCISMGLKLNNSRSLLKSLEKSGGVGVNPLAAIGMTNPNQKRSSLPTNPLAYFPPGLPNVGLNSNNSTSNGNTNAFYPMLPKYNYDAAALLASLQHPFYGMGLDPRIHPYSIHRLLELTAAGGNRLHTDPEDMIEEVTEDVVDDAPLVMDLEDQDEKDDGKIEKTEQISLPVNPDNETSSSERENWNVIEPVMEPTNKNDSNHHKIIKLKKEPIENEEEDDDQHVSNSPHSNRDSPEIKVEESAEEVLQCGRCSQRFNHQTELVQHEKVLCSMRAHLDLEEKRPEPAKREIHSSEPESVNSSFVQSGSEEDPEERESKTGSESERKVRVRTAITEEQQTILKEHYAINARPSRDEFRMIALRLGLDPRVVQVWFQNNRSRERKLNNYKNFTSPSVGQSVSPSFSPSAVPVATSNARSSKNSSSTTEDQPLDLSVKKELTTSPSNSSPRYGIEQLQSESLATEAINLSSKSSSSHSPASFASLRQYNATTPIQRQPLDIPQLIRQTPSPSEAAPLRHLHPNPYMLAGPRRLVPMECLLQMAPEYARNQLLGLKLGERGTSLSPGSEKRSWRDDESRISHDDEFNFHASKRPKLDTSGNSDLDCPFVCDQCDKAFSKQSSLARHKYEHSGQRPYKCEECPKAFKHKHHLTEHKRLHSGEKPFQCTKCLKRFSHSGSYSQHMNHRYSYCKPYRE